MRMAMLEARHPRLRRAATRWTFGAMASPVTTPPTLAPDVAQRLRALAERWSDVGAAERANYQLYLIELAEAIGVERPRPAPQGGRLAEGQAYQFEYAVQATTRDGTTTTNFIDLYKQGAFALEAKHGDEGASSLRLLTGAFGQVSNYAKDLPERPPYIMVLDVGRTLIVWDRWAGTYGGFNAGRRIDLRTLADRPDDVALLRDIWTDPSVRDPRRHAQAVTEEIAGLLAELAATLERRGHDQERVARFLIRCVFTMFAEDVHLLPDALFKRMLDTAEPAGRRGFADAAEALWKAMDEGTRFGSDMLLSAPTCCCASTATSSTTPGRSRSTRRSWRCCAALRRPTGARWSRRSSAPSSSAP
jgi:hypothetical protein